MARRPTYRWMRRFSVLRQLETLGISARIRCSTHSRSASRQQRYVSPTGDFPCRPARPLICLSMAGPMSSLPIRALCKMTRRAGLSTVSEWSREFASTYRLIPAARLHVATHTRMVPASYAAEIKSLSSLVKPACLVSPKLGQSSALQLTSESRRQPGCWPMELWAPHGERRRRMAPFLPVRDLRRCLGSASRPAGPASCRQCSGRAAAARA